MIVKAVNMNSYAGMEKKNRIVYKQLGMEGEPRSNPGLSHVDSLTRNAL